MLFRLTHYSVLPEFRTNVITRKFNGNINGIREIPEINGNSMEMPVLTELPEITRKFRSKYVRSGIKLAILYGRTLLI